MRYIHDQHLPTLLEHARGVVLLNSTVGLSALHHGTPLKVCGTALYDMDGLTFQNSLDDFWKQAGSTSVDRDLYERFHNYLVKHTQLNGSFYRRLAEHGSNAGIKWTTAASPGLHDVTKGVIFDQRATPTGVAQADAASEVV